MSYQPDFFNAPVFEPRIRIDRMDGDKFRLRNKAAMSAAMTRSAMSRDEIAARMAQMLGQPSLSKGSLDLYVSPARTTHDIPLIRFKALVKVLDAPELWDVALADDGLVILSGDEARFAEIGRLQQAQREILSQIKTLKSTPVNVRSW
jgi:hypothetical protein